ncbi:MAG: TolC family protein [Halioglobus sp.]
MTSTSIITRRAALLPLLSALLLPQACTVLGPDYQAPPAQALPSTWQASEVTDTSTANASWWQQFNDPVLDALVDSGARQNLSLEAAGLRIVQARAALGISDALIYPQLQNASGNLTKVYQNEQSLNSAGVSLDVGWEMDIWGKYARGIESAEAGLYATIASYRDVLVAITSEIARNYINYRTSQERIYLSQQNIAIQQRVVEMTQVQFDSGNVSELDVQQAKTQLYATQSTLPALRSSMAQSVNAIAVLLGTLPETIKPLLALDEEGYTRNIDDRMAPTDSTPQAHENFRAEYDSQSLIPVSPRISTTIDAQKVSARPDLQVAELQARAQNARIGARQADLYPQFFLAGSIGLSDTVPSGGSFSASNAVSAAVGPGFSWNIFQYGRIKNQVRIEDARFQEALVNYNQQVLDAVREVSNALVAYQYSREQADYNLAAVESSIRAFNISATQYDAGLVTYQRLLSTVEKMTLREDAYAQNRGSIAKNIVDLYKAMGGGWENYESQPRVHPETVETMKARTDWGDYLDAEKMMGGDRSSDDDTE